MASCLPESSGNSSTVVDTHPAAMPTAAAEHSKLMTAKNTVLTVPPPSSLLEDNMMQIDNDDDGPSSLSGQSTPHPMNEAGGEEPRQNMDMEVEKISETNDNGSSSSIPNVNAEPPSQQSSQDSSKVPTKPSTPNSQRPKKGGKEHTKENNHRPLPIIGDEYTKLVSDLRQVNDLLNGGKNAGGNEDDQVDVFLSKQRYDKMEQSAKNIKVLQLSGTLNSDCNLPSLVASEIQAAESRWEERKKEQHPWGVGKPKGDLGKAEKILSKAKSRSLELASKLKDAIVQSASEEKKEGDIRTTMVADAAKSNTSSSPRVNGSNTSGGDSKGSASEGGSSRPKQGSKSLANIKTIRQSYENSMATESSQPSQLPLPENNRIQFLATSADKQKGFDKRVSFDGNIIDRIAVVPSNDVASVEQTLLEMKKGSSSSTPVASASAEAMNSIYPTMAPPMFADQPKLPDLEKALKKKKKKKDKKRSREKSLEGSNSVAGSESSGPKKKKSRGRKSEGKHGSDLGDSSVKSTMADDSIGTKPPPATPIVYSKAPRHSPAPSNLRTIPDLTAPTKSKQYTIATDEYPQRIYNPLLRLPQFPDYPSGETPPIEEVPQAGELWNLANLHFGSGGADTYPVSYLARVLGFDVTETGLGQEFGAEFDAMKVGRSLDAVNDVDVVPKAGTFGDRIWKQHDGASCAASDAGCESGAIDSGMHDDLNLSYCDPLWANILSSYRGYNEDDFIDAGKGFYDVLSPHCLEYARERGVLSKEMEKHKQEGLSFRYGNEQDEEMLDSLAEKCPWISKSKHDRGAYLRGQSHFCIVAESLSPQPPSSSSDDDNGSNNNVDQSSNSNGLDRSVVAFLQYRFCWYSAGEKRNAVSKDKEMELVVFIENLVYNDTATVGDQDTAAEAVPSSAKKELETAKVLLTSLALVHAARAGVWYGMMESPKVLVPCFTKYFRMSQCYCSSLDETKDDSNASSRVPLALDIKKCHFKYAILLLEESLKLSSTLPCQKRSDNDCSERMIVHLRNSASAMKDISRSTRGGLLFSNSHKDEARSKKAHLRLVQKPDTTELLTVSAASSEGMTESPLDPSGIIIPDGWNVNWNVMKLFPLRDSIAQKEEANEGKQLDSSNKVSSDIFLAELHKKQSQLVQLESTIETAARGILCKAYDEHTEFVTGDYRLRAEQDKKTLEEYKSVQIRLHEAELAWQAQLDQDMDAVCDVCFDGEVTPDNQIIFCDACNVAVHQRCYGIDQIPSGNYFCHTCTHFEIDKEFLAAKRRRDGTPSIKPTRHPIVCELCPRRQGAFVKVQQGAVPTKKPRWVHVGCAKWQGMNYVDVEINDEIEDLTQLKAYFKEQSIPCMLCKSSIGALHQCREEGCNNFLHLTCARSLGKCAVQHGENCEGFYDPAELDHPPWTLACPKHSEIDPENIREGSLTAEQLVAIAESYPPEPVPLKPFNRMNGSERKDYWSEKENLEEFFEKVMSSLDGAKCALCELPADPAIDKQCDVCGVFSHADCCDPNRGDGATCFSCRFSQQNAANKHRRDYEEPKCHMCKHPNASGGPLVSSFAKPTSMKTWKGKGSLQFQRSLFGKNKLVHALCGMWNPSCKSGTTKSGDVLIDFSQITMSNGREHVSKQYRCYLCGLFTGAKAECTESGCFISGTSRRFAPKFHVTCARQAGLEVPADDNFSLKCFKHVECTYVFRARLEDMREIELNRNTGKRFNSSIPMTWNHASQLFHAAVNIMRNLGWAWRWAEWWVESGDNWEPLLEEGQVEAHMTDEELKKVKSTPESRRDDARVCRLAAFGAALRNRDYDKEDRDDQEPLERALMAVLSTKSLVGPLKKKEIEFFVTWLALAYRSKSPILGFGGDKTIVADDGFCVHQDDSSPKHELGTRPLPGKAKPVKSGSFEPRVEEPDDFLKTLTSANPKKEKRKKKKNKRKGDNDHDNDEAFETAEGAVLLKNDQENDI